MSEWKMEDIGRVRTWRVCRTVSPRGVSGLTILACNKEGKPYKGLFLPDATKEEAMQLAEILKNY